MASSEPGLVFHKWEAEASLAEVEERFGSLFEAAIYHQALREVLQPDPLSFVADFPSRSIDDQRAIAGAVLDRVVDLAAGANEVRHMLASPRVAREAVRRHLEAMPGLDRRITRKMLAPPRHSFLRQLLRRLGGSVRR